MQNQNGQPQGQGLGIKGSFNVALAIANVHAMCITPFIRTGFGIEAFGPVALASLVLMMVLGGLVPAPDMVPYVLFWMFAVLVQRGRSIKAARKGVKGHSRYQGWPALAMRLVPSVQGEMKAKMLVEPMICLVAGGLIWFVSPFVGKFVMCGFLSMAFTADVNRQFWKARVRQMKDAQIEQEQLIRMFNESDEF